MYNEEKFTRLINDAVARATPNTVRQDRRSPTRSRVMNIWRLADRHFLYDVLQGALQELQGQPRLSECSDAQLRMIEGVMQSYIDEG